MHRLNNIIRALESGQHAFASFAPPDVASAIAFSTTDYDGIVIESEHRVWDVGGLRDSLQYLLNRRQIFSADSIGPAVTPLVRIPPNGGERSQWHAKQALDIGMFGIVWPHVSTVEDAYNAVSACRYPRPARHAYYEPVGVRGDGPAAAARYWGLSQAEYYRAADTWPLNPAGEVFVVIMIEDVQGVENLADMLENVPGIAMVLIGEGDLSQELGFPREYEHPEVLDCKAKVLDTCNSRGVVVGHPHVNVSNIGAVIESGYRFLMTPPVTTYPALAKGRSMTDRD